MLSFVIVLRHADKVRHTADHLLHLFLVLLVGFLPLGVFKFIPCTCPMDVGDVLAHHFILPRQLIDLKFQFPLASLHTEEQSVGNRFLYTVEVAFEGGYESQSKFGVAFKESFCISPMEYKRGGKSADGKPEIAEKEM